MSSKEEGPVNDPLPNPSPLEGGGFLPNEERFRALDASIGLPTGRCQ